MRSERGGLELGLRVEGFLDGGPESRLVKALLEWYN